MSNVGTLQASAADLYSAAYAVFVNEKPVRVFACRVSAMPFNQVWKGYQRPLGQTEEAAFVRFDLPKDGAPVRVAVTVAREFREAVVRPLSRGIRPVREGNVLSFTVGAPGALSLELDGRHQPLTIFADPARDGAVDPENYTYYFGPGIHEVGEIELRSGETLMIDDGAVVFGSIHAEDAENIGVFGRGILDGSHRSRTEPLRWEHAGLANFVRCRNVKVEDVIFAHAEMWNMTAWNCVGMEFRNAKVVGAWRYNTDGFDFVNSQKIRLDGCFLRTFDDTVVLKGMYFEGKDYERMNVADVLVENCVLWCDWGGAMEIGAETVADEYRNITYRNIDVICNTTGAMRIHAGDRAAIHGVTYDDIRVEYSRADMQPVLQTADDMVYDPGKKTELPAVVAAWMYCGKWSPYNVPGQVYDITYRNIAVFTEGDEETEAFLCRGDAVRFEGADAEHTLRDVRIEGLTLNGKPFSPTVHTNEFAHGITLV